MNTNFAIYINTDEPVVVVVGSGEPRLVEVVNRLGRKTAEEIASALCAPVELDCRLDSHQTGLVPGNYRERIAPEAKQNHKASSAARKKAIDVLIERGETVEAAASRVERLSRQRVYQIIWRATGRCRCCSGDSNGRVLCEKCANKVNAHNRRALKTEHQA